MRSFNTSSIIFICFLSFFSFFPDIQGKPAKPGIINYRQPDGSMIEILLKGDFHNRAAYNLKGEKLKSDENGFYIVNLNKEENLPVKTETIGTRGIGRWNTTFPSIGSPKSIAILVEFPDKKFSLENPQDFFYRMLNEESFSDYGATGSARDYFIKNSEGKFSPEFDVFGPVTLRKSYTYYGGGNDYNAPEMISEACDLLDEEIDFSLYDYDGNGEIDNVYIFYAGYGEADGGGLNTIWPHSWDMLIARPNDKHYYDGILLNHYACSNELQYNLEIPDGIGTFCHEFGHVLGLPDLYNTGYQNAFTPGSWSIMDVGSYNNNSYTPPNYSAFERYALDWIEPNEFLTSGNYILPPLSDENKAFIVKTNNDNEYFLFENRQLKDYDTYLPGHGMLVWHIDYNKYIWDEQEVNNNPNHQYVDLMEADAILTSDSRGGDSFPGTANINSFTCETKPYFRTWEDTPLPIDIVQIEENADGHILLKIENCESSAVSSIRSDEFNFIIDGRRIIFEEDGWSVYGIAGNLILNSKNDAFLEPGVYIAVKGNLAKKFIIK